MYDVVLSFITAFAVTYFAIPSIIHIANEKGLCDEPGDRRSHTVSTPSLGGIGIFAGLIFSVVLWTPFHLFNDLQYILCAFIIIFFVGIKDDIIPVPPHKKLFGEIIAAGILVFKANVKITSLYGLFGITILPIWVSAPLSIFTIIVIINAFNLIDGINGLSGSIGVLIAVTLGTWFILIDRFELSVIAYSMAGSAVAFLKYNYTPAKIFMGDTGSLLLGLGCSVLTLKFIELHQLIPEHPYAFDAVPAVAIGILILPLYDTLRVFVMRIVRGRSPLSPDRNHIHHLLIDFGYTHMQATSLLVVVNIAFILMVFSLQSLGTIYLLALTFTTAIGLSALLFYLVRRRNIRLS